MNGIARLFYAPSPPRPPRLPEGYTELEYIIANGGQHIDTKAAASFGTTVKIKAQITQTVENVGSAALFYSHFRNQVGSAGVSIGEFTANANRDGNVFVRCGYSSYTEQGSADRIPALQVASGIYIPFELSLSGGGEVEFNGLEYKTNSLYNTPMKSQAIILGPEYSTLTHPPINIYYFQVYYKNTDANEDVLVKDFVPCKNAAGMIGMYDLVSGFFFSSSSGTAFLAGPEI